MVCEVPLEDKDRIELAEKISVACLKRDEAEAEKSAIDKKLNKDITGYDNEISQHAATLRSGKHSKGVEHFWRYLWHDGIKELVRADTGTIVKSEPIKDSERQLVMNLEEQEEIDRVTRGLVESAADTKVEPEDGKSAAAGPDPAPLDPPPTDDDNHDDNDTE